MRQRNSTVTCVMTKLLNKISKRSHKLFRKLLRFITLHLDFVFQTPKQNTRSTVTFWVGTFTVRDET